MILPDSIASSQDLAAVLGEIRQYTQWYVHESIKQRVGVGARASKSQEPVLSEAAADLIRETAKQGPLSRMSLERLTKTLEGFSKTSPVVTITLAAPVTKDVKQRLVDWCRHNIAENVLVTFQHNATILGGMVFRYKSRVFDWSFRRAILDNRVSFAEVLRSV